MNETVKFTLKKTQHRQKVSKSGNPYNFFEHMCTVLTYITSDINLRTPPPTTPHPLVSCIRAQPRAGSSGQEQFFPGHSGTAASCFHKASSPPLAAPRFSARPPITPTSASSPNSPVCDHFRTSCGLSHLPPTAPNLSVPLLIWQSWNMTKSGSRERYLSWSVCILKCIRF